MKPFYLFFLIFLFHFQVKAHPSWGLVVDSKGLIYFVDILHDGGTLWQYNPNTKHLKSLIKGHFHAHSLQIDDEDNLYIGVNLWIQDKIMGDGHNYLFKYNIKSNNLDTLLFSKKYEKYFGGNILYNPQQKVVYFPHKNKLHGYDFKLAKSFEYTQKPFQRFSTMNYDPSGNIWIADSYANNGSLYIWSQTGGLNIYADCLISQKPPHPPYKEKSHWLIYGIGFSSKGHPIICESGERQVSEILPSGKKRLIYQSPLDYFPTGVYYKNGKIYVMEVGYKKGKGHVGPNIVIITNNNASCYELAY